MDDLYRKGADPSVVIGDMLDLSHLLTRIRAVPSAKTSLSAMAKEEMERAADMASKLSMPALTRVWQILLKGLNEVNYAPIPQKAAEMVVIRLAYAADLPDPADLIKKLKDGGASMVQMSGGTGEAHAPVSSAPLNIASTGGRSFSNAPTASLAVQSISAPEAKSIASLQDVMAVLERAGYIALSSQVYLCASGKTGRRSA